MSEIRKDHLRLVGVDPEQKEPKLWEVRAAKDNPKVGEVLIYGPIFGSALFDDEVSPKRVRDDLKALGDVDAINVFINSPGGSVFAGHAIHAALSRHKAEVTVFVDGVAASAASVVAMAGDRIVMPVGSSMMIHNPRALAMGQAEDMRRMADTLDKLRDNIAAVYEHRTGIDQAELLEMMDAETWMTAEEAVDKGFADEVEQSQQVAASLDGDFLMVNGERFDLSQYKQRPKVPEVTEPKASANPNPQPDPPQLKAQQPAEGGSLSIRRRRLDLMEMESSI